MSACLCELCRPGNPAPTYTQAFRHACEVRAVLALASNEARKEYLAGVLKARGQENCDRLRSDALREFQQREEVSA